MRSFYNTEEGLKTWLAIAERHRLRDERFLPILARHFKPGTVHEIGAATGSLSAILKAHGVDISCSDLHPTFVEHMRSRGLDAHRFDATRLDQETDRRFDNILAQAVSPLSERKPKAYMTTLQAVYRTLKPEGRLVVLFSIKRDDYNRTHYYQPDEQVELVVGSGLFNVVAVIPHQVTPPGIYRPWNAAVLNWADFALARVWSNRKVLVFERV